VIHLIKLLFCVLIFLSSCLEKDKEQEKSQIDFLNTSIESNPNDVNLLYKRAKYNKQRNYLESVLFDLNKCVEIDSLNDLYHFELACVYFDLAKQKNGNSDFPIRAKNHLIKSIELDQSKPKYKALLGELYLAFKKYNDAIILFNKSLELEYNQPKTHMLMGYAYKQLNNYENAINCFHNSINIDPEFKESFIQLGNILHLMKDTNAILYYNNALKLDPDDEITLYNKALFYQDLMDWNNALVAYAELHKVSPFHSSGHYNLGFIHMELGLFDIAANNFSDAIYSNSEFYEAYYSRGICFQKIGNINQAIIDFKRAIEIKSDYNYAIEALEEVNKLSKTIN